MGIGTLDERKQSGAEPKSDRWLKQYSRLFDTPRKRSCHGAARNPTPRV